MDHLLFLLSVLKDDEDRLDLIHARTSTPPLTIIFLHLLNFLFNIFFMKFSRPENMPEGCVALDPPVAT